MEGWETRGQEEVLKPRKSNYLQFLLKLTGGEDISPDLPSDLVIVPRTAKEGWRRPSKHDLRPTGSF